VSRCGRGYQLSTNRDSLVDHARDVGRGCTSRRTKRNEALGAYMTDASAASRITLSTARHGLSATLLLQTVSRRTARISDWPLLDRRRWKSGRVGLASRHLLAHHESNTGRRARCTNSMG